MTSWNRRLNVASASAARQTFSKGAFLEEANALGVSADGQAALLAMGKLANDRDDFRVTIGVRVGDDETLFEVVSTPEGPTARPVGQLPGAIGGQSSHSGDDSEGDHAASDSGPNVVSMLTDTLVQTPDLVAIFDSVGHEAIWANDAFVTLIPIRVTDKVWLVELLDQWSKGHYEVKILPALVKYGRWSGRLVLNVSEDEHLAVSAVVVAHRDRNGEIEAVSMVARDLAEMQLTMDQLSADATPFAALVEHVTDLIAVMDESGVVKYASPAAARALGFDEGKLAGVDLAELIHPEDRRDDLLSFAQTDEMGVGVPVELRLRARDGSWRYLEVVVSDLTANPAIGGIVLNARDVTERVETISALAAKAYTDQLTGLPNRMRLLDRTAQALQDREDGSPFGMLLVDVDRFRSVNDVYGQPVGDAVLREVAERLVAAVPEGITVARVRSDEFVVLLGTVSDNGDMVRMAASIREAVAVPFEHEGHTLGVTVSIGISVADASGTSESMLRHADQALEKAKQDGGDRYVLFSTAMADEADHRLSVERQLRARLDGDDLGVHYQPIVDLETRKLVGAEALLRVEADEGGVISPAELIEAAESSGLIAMLGSQVIDLAAEQLAVWSSIPETNSIGEVSVNISPRQLADPDLPKRVLGALNAASIAPERLCLEITESVMIGQHTTIDASISYLREVGVRIGLDEFGVGQSSLGYLKRFPIDFVKIDRSLIAGLGRNEQDTAIVRATIDLAHNLDLTVVAVGVENEEQVEILKMLGCDRAQGFLFAAPLPAEELAGLSL